MHIFRIGLVSRLAVLLIIPFAGTLVGQLTVTGLRSTATLSATGAWTITAQGWNFGGTVGSAIYASTINSGTDNLGRYQELAFGYAVGSSSRSASIRVYPARAVALFSLTYNGYSANVAPFPVLTTYPKLLHATFSGEFAQPDFINLAADSPAVYYDASANAYVLSAASDFMTSATVWNGDGSMGTGISSRIGWIPAGTTHQTVLAYGAGINATLSKWGLALTDLSGKKRPANNADALLRSISYWTDNGATYYYNPGGPSYTGTLQTMKGEFDKKGIRLGSMQLDSWWYPKGPTDIWSDHEGIWTYTASTDLFPTGLADFQAKLGTPLIAHSRWIDANSPYRTQYLMSGDVSIDPQFWEDIGAYLQASGVTVYEQDWLGNKAKTLYNLTDPYAYLGNMAASMARHGITIQYCTPTPGHYLQSTKYDNLTTIRVSNDRFQEDRWTYFFYSGRLASALGVWPFTDVFMSGETNNLIAATISAGPVGVGDPMGALSQQNLLQAARPDGVIVKPDVAAAPLDSVFINDAQGVDVPMVVTAYTDFGAGLKANYIFAYPRGANKTITIQPGSYGIIGQSYLYDYLNGTGHFLDAHASYKLDLTSGPGYFILMPAGKTGIAFMGDKGHFATLGKARIAAFADTGKVDVTVSFTSGEKARTLFGFSPGPVTATAVAGSATPAVWDPATQMFSMTVTQATSGTTAGTARVRLIQSFGPGATATSSNGDCRYRCSGSNPVPGPVRDR
ncbi:MAG: hypothetical protein ABJC09_02420 [Terriglobia bacterium]